MCWGKLRYRVRDPLLASSQLPCCRRNRNSCWYLGLAMVHPPKYGRGFGPQRFMVILGTTWCYVPVTDLPRTWLVDVQWVWAPNAGRSPRNMGTWSQLDWGTTRILTACGRCPRFRKRNHQLLGGSSHLHPVGGWSTPIISGSTPLIPATRDITYLGFVGWSTQ